MLYNWHCLWEEIGYPDKIVKIIEGACKWEIEHGLEVTFSDGEIIYVGGFGDYGPNTSCLQYHLDKYGYYDPAKDMNENYADCVKIE